MNDPKNTGTNEDQSTETAGDEPSVIVDTSQLGTTDADAEASSSETQAETDAAPEEGAQTVETQPMEAAPDMTAPSPTEIGQHGNVTEEPNEEEFFIPQSNNRGLKALGLGVLALALLAGIAYLGTSLTSSSTAVSDGNGDVATESSPTTPAEPAPVSEPPATAEPSGSVTVTTQAFDRFDLQGCTRANLTIEADGTWVFRNCAKPVLPTGGGQ